MWTRIYVYLYTYIYIYIYICTYICIFPKLALAIGVLTFLYKGPWMVTGTAPNAVRHLCV